MLSKDPKSPKPPSTNPIPDKSFRSSPAPNSPLHTTSDIPPRRIRLDLRVRNDLLPSIPIHFLVIKAARPALTLVKDAAGVLRVDAGAQPPARRAAIARRIRGVEPALVGKGEELPAGRAVEVGTPLVAVEVRVEGRLPYAERAAAASRGCSLQLRGRVDAGYW